MKRQVPMQAHQLEKVAESLDGRPGLSPSLLPFLTGIPRLEENGFEDQVQHKFEDEVPRREQSFAARSARSFTEGEHRGGDSARRRHPQSTKHAGSAVGSAGDGQSGTVADAADDVAPSLAPHRIGWQELSLPPGCVLAARYGSRWALAVRGRVAIWPRRTPRSR